MAPEQPADPGLPAVDDLVAVGIIRKAHGVRGEASVEPLTDRPERFRELRTVYLVSPARDEHRAARIESVRSHSGRLLILFDDFGTPEALAAVRGWTIEIPPSETIALEEGEYFLHDLAGLAVIDSRRGRIGEVLEAYPGGGGVLLEVKRDAGGTFEVPFASEICSKIDLAEKRLFVELPEGLDRLEDLDEEPGEPIAASELSTPRLRLDFITIFPAMFDPFLAEGVVAQAMKKNILEIRVWDLRQFAADRHRTTDDEPYGGGSGMVMLAEPLLRAVDAVRLASGEPGEVIVPSPQGVRFTHAVAEDLARSRRLIFLCGRYEGFDQRVYEALAPREISLGDFVVSGGELPAMIVADAVSRLVEGVVGDWSSVEHDSFYGGLLDHPHYTRPAEVRGMKVPEVLTSGHAEKIRRWRREQAIRATLEKRPDLLESAPLDAEAAEILDRLRNERG